MKKIVISFLNHSKSIHFPLLFYNSSRFLPFANLTPTKGSLFNKGDVVNFKIWMASLFDKEDGEIKLAKRWPFIMRRRFQLTQSTLKWQFPFHPRYNTFAPFNFFTTISFHIFFFRDHLTQNVFCIRFYYFTFAMKILFDREFLENEVDRVND